MICTVAEFRTFDQGGAYAKLDDETITAELEHAEEYLFGFVENRGYGPITSANVAVHRAILKVARLELLAIRGVNPGDPGHQLIILERDRAVEWFRKAIASGEANLVGVGAPTRTRTGVAGVFSGCSADDGEGPRGW